MRTTLGFSAAAAVGIAIANAGVGQAAAMTPDMQTVFENAVKVVDQYWATHYTESFGGTYKSPHVNDPIDRPLRTACGTMPVNNAAQCSGDDSLTFGNQFLARASEFGDLLIYDVVAHEWGHAILDRAGVRNTELHAECLAGAAIGGSIRDGKLSLPDGDGAALEKIENEFGADHPAQSDTDHGTAQQQIDEYRKGFSQGPLPCVGRKAPEPAAQPAPKPAPETKPTPTPAPVVVQAPPAPAPVSTPVSQPVPQDSTPAAPSDAAVSGSVPDPLGFGSLS